MSYPNANLSQTLTPVFALVLDSPRTMHGRMSAIKRMKVCGITYKRYWRETTAWSTSMVTRFVLEGYLVLIDTLVYLDTCMKTEDFSKHVCTFRRSQTY